MKQYLYFIIVIAILVISCVILYSHNNALRQEIIINKAIHAQNVEFLKDSINKLVDSIQVTTVKIVDLNNENNDLIKENKILITKYKLILDSLKLSNTTSVVFNEDSIGKYVIASFSGKKSIVNFDGYTKTYLTPLATKSTYVLNLSFDPIYTNSELLFNDTTKLFYIKTTSLTEGVKLIGYSVLDSSSYYYLYTHNISKENVNNNIFIGGSISRDELHAGIMLKIPNWILLFNYRFFDKYNSSEIWYNRVQLGLYYNLF
jgi:hypothetical protein